MAESKPNQRIKRSLRIAVDQHSEAIQNLADTFGLTHARDSMCGFIALAIIVMVKEEEEEVKVTEATILPALEQHILPWIVDRRETYVKEHGDEFVPTGTSYKDANGRMSVDLYQAMMASTTELAEFLSTSKLLQQEKSTVALLRNVLEGPVVDDETSLRFPRRGSFISQEDLAYIEQEKPFWGDDHYVQLSGGTLVSLFEWCKAVIAERAEWNILIDNHGHYHVLRISFEKDNHCMLLEELDTIQRDDDDETHQSQPCENLVRVLQSLWLKNSEAGGSK